jgi:hypothetical protein
MSLEYAPKNEIEIPPLNTLVDYRQINEVVWQAVKLRDEGYTDKRRVDRTLAVEVEDIEPFIRENEDIDTEATIKCAYIDVQVDDIISLIVERNDGIRTAFTLEDSTFEGQNYAANVEVFEVDYDTTTSKEQRNMSLNELELITRALDSVEQRKGAASYIPRPF